MHVGFLTILGPEDAIISASVNMIHHRWAFDFEGYALSLRASQYGGWEAAKERSAAGAKEMMWCQDGVFRMDGHQCVHWIK